MAWANHMGEITALLHRSRNGDEGARERLYSVLYGELKCLARSHLARSPGLSLDPTAMVHELWLRSQQGEAASMPENRRLFFGHASAVMRSVILDHVRARRAAKRGHGQAVVTLSTTRGDGLPGAPDAIGLNEALVALARIDERCHSVVEMRYFGGLTEPEIAEVLGVSLPTVQRDWQRARAFLFDHLRE
jgi:RNA polymerase sigma factor (TIGR02999 family)